jgi:Glycosyltransferase family 25 (LPS biosynthesis protein)
MELLQHILYINLGYRQDRNEHCLAEFQKLGIPESGVERFPAIQTTTGSVGCTMSHIKCIELAKQKGWDQVFICEDDIEFTNPDLFTTQLKKLYDSKIDWNVLVVGGNNAPPFQPINDFCVRVFNIQTTTGYIIKKHYYDTLIGNFKEGLMKLMREPSRHKEFAIDIYWKQLQQRDQWLILIPLTVCQYYDFSDIEGKVVDYKDMMLDLEKKALFEHYMKLEAEQNRFKTMKL